MFNHGQTISFGDGQQAIILQNPDPSGQTQSRMFGNLETKVYFVNKRLLQQQKLIFKLIKKFKLKNK